ncbi:MAG: hypothetical protein AAF821_25755, partial [Cyanobacteria bacterium P01_D01_bin.156]
MAKRDIPITGLASELKLPHPPLTLAPPMTAEANPSSTSTIKLEPSWKAVLEDVFATPHMQAL